MAAVLVGRDGEQDLARTATAVASVAAAGPGTGVSGALGRYRLERELGAGAMGVVYAAFDPDLERRIALKVLRGPSATLEAKNRLMREARAMARLSHANVVTVYEVGTTAGRDFVAMELIDGESLAQWLRGEPRRPAMILDAFVAAGRGLAAAHAAGIVHRDFKPHNVLRSAAGRIVVTDFGLAREAQDAPAAPPPRSSRAAPTGAAVAESPSALAGITVTGSLLGTPPYMAPEQWNGDAVTPATDQFAYCVALWEALAGSRPYHGATLAELREQIGRGPAELDASRIPRGVRALLRRGLDPEPARRWPSMDALLAQLTRARAPGRRAAISIARLAALVTAVLGGIAQLSGGSGAAPCAPPGRELDDLWPVASHTRPPPQHRAVLAAALRDWRFARTAACQAPRPVRAAQLHCLDRVAARLAAVQRGFARVPDSDAENLQLQLVDPQVCRTAELRDVPQLTIEPSDAVVAAYALLAGAASDAPPSDREIAALAEPAARDGCARGIAILAFDAASLDVPRRRALMKGAAGVADRCGDDRLRADLMIRDIEYRRERPVIGPEGDAAIERAQGAAERVMQGELAAQLAAQRSAMAGERGRWADAFHWSDRALAVYRTRDMPTMQVRTMIARGVLHDWRGLPEDLDAITADVATWRRFALAHGRAELARRLDVLAARARYQVDVAAAHDDMLRLWRTQPRAEQRGESRRIAGEVVDPQGRPVAGATVATSLGLYGDAAGIAVPQLLPHNDFRDTTLAIATSDGAGHFVIEHALANGVIAAQSGDLRSRPVKLADHLPLADHVRLVVAPTRRIAGQVALGGIPFTRVRIICTPVTAGDRYGVIAPVAPGGAFSLAGAPTTAIRLGVVVIDDGSAAGGEIQSRVLPASRSPIVGLALDAARPARRIDVVVHSAVDAPLIGATVNLLAGKRVVARLSDLMALGAAGMQTVMATPVIGLDYPAAMRTRFRPGDLLARVEHARPGELTVCATSWAGDPLDPRSNQRVFAHLGELVTRCAAIGPDVDVVELDAPPQPHFQ